MRVLIKPKSKVYKNVLSKAYIHSIKFLDRSPLDRELSLGDSVLLMLRVYFPERNSLYETSYQVTKEANSYFILSNALFSIYLKKRNLNEIITNKIKLIDKINKL